jgi:hypothetical protein
VFSEGVQHRLRFCLDHLSRIKMAAFHFISSQSQSHIATDGQSVSMSWCRAQLWDFWPEIFFYFFFFESYGLVFYWGALSDERSGLSCVSLCL